MLNIVLWEGSDEPSNVMMQKGLLRLQAYDTKIDSSDYAWLTDHGRYHAHQRPVINSPAVSNDMAGPFHARKKWPRAVRGGDRPGTSVKKKR